MKLIQILLLSLLITNSGCSPKIENNYKYDIVIYGGTSAGVIAAYSAYRLGKSVIIVEPGMRLGGLSAGGLGQTDIGNKYAITGLSRDFYRRIGKYYAKFESWTFEPKVALKIYQDYIDEGNINVLYNTRLTKVNKNESWIESLEVENPFDSELSKVTGKMFIDCSYEGDLMAKSGVSYVIGRESNSKYNEFYNGVQLLDKHQFPDGIDPYKIKGDSNSGLLWGIRDYGVEPNGTGDKKVQAYNFRICLTDSIENMIPITKPDNYKPEQYELLIRLMESEKDPQLWNYFSWGRMPNRKTDINNNGAFSTDMIGENWDYPEANYEKRSQIFKKHLDYTKGLLYFVITDERVPKDVSDELKKWGYPKDEYTDNNNFTPQMYVREARRMVGEYVMTEHNCVGRKTVEDEIGLAAYTMDSHNCDRIVVNNMVKNEGDVQIGGFGPYPISYRSITPKREEVKNLLVSVGISASHIAYGSIRMEPVFMVLGQSAAVAASLAIDEDTYVQNINVDSLQSLLKNNPLLDGHTSEILIDNDLDPEKVTINGKWEKIKGDWGSKANGTHLLINWNPAKSDQVVFSPQISSNDFYELYVYSPNINGFLNSSDMKKAEGASCRIENEGFSKIVNFKFTKERSDWVNIGKFEFGPASNPKIIISTLEKNVIGIDAILLVPEKN